MKLEYSAAELSGILGISVRAIRKRSAKECWPCREELNRRGGGTAKVFPYDGLPDDVKLQVCLYERQEAGGGRRGAGTGKALEPANGNGAGALVCGGCLAGLGSFAGLRKEQLDEALAHGRLVSLYKEYIKKRKPAHGQVLAVKQEFVRAYNLGPVGSYPELYAVIGPTSIKSIERWAGQLLMQASDPVVLADRRGQHRRGATTVAPEQQRILRNLALSPNRPLLSEVIRGARALMLQREIPAPQSDDTFRRWLRDFKKHYYAEWVLYREGEKALNEKCVPHIQRDMDRIEVGDVLVADGHVLNWEIWNPWAGRAQRMTLIVWYDMRSNYAAGWEIMPTENTQAICAALHRAILCLGKIPKVPYLDNGRAFRSKFFNGVQDFRTAPFVGLFQRLGMQPTFAWPYHAESKPVEGFFRVFAELERQAPSYTGTTIDDKPARMKRNEKLHKALHQALTGGQVPTIEQSHLAIASYLDAYHERAQKGHLRGACPREVFDAGRGPGFNPEEMMQLRLLMMSHEIKKIHRDGIKLPGVEEYFYHPDLYGRQQQSALVRYDLRDLARVWVFDLENNFICEAERQSKLHPMARQLGTEQDVIDLQQRIELKRSLAKQTMAPARAFLEEHIMPEVRRQMESIGFEPGNGKDKLPSTSPGEDLPEVEPMTAERWERVRAEAEEKQRWGDQILAGREADDETVWVSRVAASGDDDPDAGGEEPVVWDVLKTLADDERYQRGIDLEVRGVLIPKLELAWRAYYEATEGYERLREYFAHYRVKAVYLHQKETGEEERRWVS